MKFRRISHFSTSCYIRRIENYVNDSVWNERDNKLSISLEFQFVLEAGT